MKPFIPDQYQTITLPIGIDFRQRGQRDPYRDKELEAKTQRLRMELLGGCAAQIMQNGIGGLAQSLGNVSQFGTRQDWRKI